MLEASQVTPPIFMSSDGLTTALMPLIFRTDIKTKKKRKAVALMLDNDASIVSWSVDLQDIDNVLRIEPTWGLSEPDVIAKVRAIGFYCEPLDT